jgi:hypothetical protein
VASGRECWTATTMASKPGRRRLMGNASEAVLTARGRESLSAPFFMFGRAAGRRAAPTHPRCLGRHRLKECRSVERVRQKWNWGPSLLLALLTKARGGNQKVNIAPCWHSNKQSAWLRPATPHDPRGALAYAVERRNHRISRLPPPEYAMEKTAMEKPVAPHWYHWLYPCSATGGR